MRALLPLILLAACSSIAPNVTPAPEITRVILYPTTLTVEMSDGSLCVGTAAAGLLTGCAHALPYQVVSRPSTPRQILAPGSAGSRALVSIGENSFSA